MKRLGVYSGNIYNEDQVHNMGECGVMLTETQAIDENFLKQCKLRNELRCSQCRGCPKKQEEANSDD